MHPASSVIAFTVASGAGYGFMVSLALALIFGGAMPEGAWRFVYLAAGFTLIVGGLLSSTFHLGRPERAWRALTQWRSSWLSREGVFALAFFVPSGIFAILLVFAPHTLAGRLGIVLALLVIALAIATVFATGMIYAQLKAVPAWATPLTPIVYLALGAASGAALLAALRAISGAPLGLTPAGAQIALTIAGIAKALYWLRLQKPISRSNASTATGLSAGGNLRMIDAPHTEANYLMKEMGFRLARSHAQKLRWAAIGFGFVLPPVLYWLGGRHGGAGMVYAAPLAFLFMMAGIICERWLFFAEAKHVVMLFYGEKRI